ncbi:hypothetical protein NC653_000367 [Populus alba x Populus x berolinensis]|uniref:Uncharacterized protein n=2 Tax=Populus TaxID=3689 RepID=A0A4U5PUX4_POPAL|nr:hypothetical protein NC653_000367 [Populus alba x Populus x berolinensis]TKS00959.1 hypothetical protein D5086_0000177820 [Populus alba]
MGQETGNGRFGFVLGLRGKESFWLARGENETEGKRLESGTKGVFVLWSGVCGRKESAGAVSGAVGWRRGRLLLIHGSENQKQGGRPCFFFLFFSKGGSDQKKKMKRV